MVLPPMERLPPKGEANGTVCLPLAGEGAPLCGADEVEASPLVQVRLLKKRSYKGLRGPKALPSSVPCGGQLPPPPRGEANGTVCLPLAGEGAPLCGADEVEASPLVQVRLLKKRSYKGLRGPKALPSSVPCGDSFPPGGEPMARPRKIMRLRSPPDTRTERCAPLRPARPASTWRRWSAADTRIRDRPSSPRGGGGAALSGPACS